MSVNKINIQKAINVIKRAKESDHCILNMNTWQEWLTSSSCLLEEEKNNCGTPMCFAGHIAISPEFQGDGGSVHYNGSPKIVIGNENLLGESAIEYWLGISERQSESLCYLDYEEDSYLRTREDVITWDDILKALNSLLETGELPYAN